MKVIDLLNKITNGEEVPYEIKYNGRTYKWCRDIGDYRIDGYAECLIIKSIFGTFDCCGKHNSLYNMIFDEVEIIEEEKKITPTDFENLGYALGSIQKYINKGYDKAKEENNKIEKLDTWFSMENVQNNGISNEDFIIKYANYNFESYFNKINEIIDKINGGNNE